MLNPFREVNWRPQRADLRRFARSLMLGLPCLALLWLGVGRLSGGAWNVRQALWLGGAGAACGVVLWALPVLARPVYLVWYAAACAVGLVVGNVLLSAIFYVLVTGLGLLRRTLGRSPIQKSCDRQAPSYWREVEQPPEPQRYYRQF